LQPFLASTGIVLDQHQQLPLSIWEEAGRAYGEYALRRKSSRGGLLRRLLADFVVGRTLTRLVLRWSRWTRNSIGWDFLRWMLSHLSETRMACRKS
jgi:hypothetical protein